MFITAEGQAKLKAFLSKITELHVRALQALFDKQKEVLANSKMPANEQEAFSAKCTQLLSTLKGTSLPSEKQLAQLTKDMQELNAKFESAVNIRLLLDGPKVKLRTLMLSCSQIGAMSGIVAKVLTLGHGDNLLNHLIFNAKFYLSSYEIVNANDGSWAIAIADNFGCELATLYNDLLLEFYADLSSGQIANLIGGIKPGENEIKVGVGFLSKTLSKKDPATLVKSMCDQMRATLLTYDYMMREPDIRREFSTINKDHISDLTLQAPDKIQSALKIALSVPANFYRTEEFRHSNGVLHVKNQAGMGGHGFKLVSNILHVCRSTTLSGFNSETSLRILDECAALVRTDFKSHAVEQFRQALQDFLDQAAEYLKSDHAKYKVAIIKELREAILAEMPCILTNSDPVAAGYSMELTCSVATLTLVRELKNIPGQEAARLGYAKALLGHLKNYAKTQQVEAGIAACLNQPAGPRDFKNRYLLTPLELRAACDREALERLQSLHVKLMAMQEPSSEEDIRLLSDYLHLLRTVYLELFKFKSLNIVVHELLKLADEAITQHNQLVATNGHTLQETGEMLSELYFSLLGTLPTLTMNNSPSTLAMIIVAKAEVQGMQRVLEIKQAEAVAEVPSQRQESPRANGLFGKPGSGVVDGDVPENSPTSGLTLTMGTGDDSN